MTDVVLVSMPFGSLFSPSLGLSLLRAGLVRRGVSCRVLYFTFPFARLVGRAFYSVLSEYTAAFTHHLPGEWIFAQAAFGPRPASDRRWLEALREGRERGERPVSAARRARLLRARALADEFLERCAADVLREQPRVVGFTSVFQQHVASLALAARLKREAPGLVIVFGGSNCEGVMGAETLRRFESLDACVSGEADLVFPELVTRALDERPLDAAPGVFTRASLGRAGCSSAAAVGDLDLLPEPEFDDWFDAFQASGYAREWQPRLFFESSRGCWWGQKQHCTFCGLNGQTMAYRSKSPRRALDELTRLATRHPGCDVQVVDNILDMRYFDSLLPELAARDLSLELFYETKSNLRKAQVRVLRAAGVGAIQPGIESFSDSVLKLMRKGVTGLQNVQLLKWCRELGVKPYWNLLWGFPGEDPQEYARLARLVPHLAHLDPPAACDGMRLDRFSPNFSDAERLGLRDVRPMEAYHAVYPLPREAVANLAYHFTFRYADGRDPARYTREALRAVQAWQRRPAGSALFVVDLGRHAVVCDLRPAAHEPLTVLGELEAALYRACDAVADARRLADGARVEPGLVEQRLEPLVERGLLLREGSRYLALALTLGEYAPDAASVGLFCAILRRFGREKAARIILHLTPCEDAPWLRRPAAPARSGRRPRVRARDVGRLELGQFRVDPRGLELHFAPTRRRRS